MKKIILGLVFVFATGTSFMNANSSNQNNNSRNIEYFSCLMDAYENANREEAASPGGAYSWTHEQWTAVFELSFGVCQALEVAEE